jgi:hypothetical protein
MNTYCCKTFNCQGLLESITALANDLDSLLYTHFIVWTASATQYIKHYIFSIDTVQKVALEIPTHMLWRLS